MSQGAAANSNNTLKTQVKKLVEDLKNGSIEVKRKAASEVRLMAKDKPGNRKIIAECEGAISILVRLLESKDSATQDNAVTALCNLSLEEKNVNDIVNANSIKPLISVLEAGSPEAKENAAATLYNLSGTENNRIKIGESGAIVPLVGLLENGTPRGKKDAATALFNLSGNDGNKSRVVQAGAVKHLIELMGPTFGMADKAVAVLSNLSTSLEGKEAIRKGKGIPDLVEVVELGSGRGRENAVAALLNLCRSNNECCNEVLEEGAVPPLLELLQSGTPRAREKALQLLNIFRSRQDENTGKENGNNCQGDGNNSKV